MHTSEGILSQEQLARYARQIGPGVLDEPAQRRLARSTALVSRVGGMGGPAAMALVHAGIGRLLLAHGGRLEPADLNRQVLGTEDGIGQPRAEQFARTLRARNRWAAVESIDHEPDDREAQELASRSQVVLSCAPTFAERLRLNAAACRAGVPLVDAAQWGMTGTLVVVVPGRTACLRCLYPAEPPFEEAFPVLGAISAAIGSLAALEAIKILTEVGTSLAGKMWIIDGMQGRISTVELVRDPDCPCCGSPGEETAQRQSLGNHAAQNRLHR